MVRPLRTRRGDGDTRRLRVRRRNERLGAPEVLKLNIAEIDDQPPSTSFRIIIPMRWLSAPQDGMHPLDT